MKRQGKVKERHKERQGKVKERQHRLCVRDGPLPVEYEEYAARGGGCQRPSRETVGTAAVQKTKHCCRAQESLHFLVVLSQCTVVVQGMALF